MRRSTNNELIQELQKHPGDATVVAEGQTLQVQYHVDSETSHMEIELS